MTATPAAKVHGVFERTERPLAPSERLNPMSDNKRTIERYMDGFRHTDRSKILSCLTEDVEWEIPGYFSARGRAEFDSRIVEEGFIGSPVIHVTRLVEENDVVVAEGTVRANRTDGTTVNLVFCDVFDMRLGKIRRLVSYLVVAAKSR
jgi:uncharacterized protein